jgi:formylglycine-generating enzyme required for sulfatase activity
MNSKAKEMVETSPMDASHHIKRVRASYESQLIRLEALNPLLDKSSLGPILEMRGGTSVSPRQSAKQHNPFSFPQTGTPVNGSGSALNIMSKFYQFLVMKNTTSRLLALVFLAVLPACSEKKPKDVTEQISQPDVTGQKSQPDVTEQISQPDVTGQKSQPDVTGQIFVVTQSGENIKMGGLEVLVIPDSEFQTMAKTTVSWMQDAARAEAQQEIDSEYMNTFIREEIEVEENGAITIPEMERIRMSILDESETLKNHVESGVSNYLFHRGFSKLISTSTSQIIVSTDADGRFTVPTTGKIWFIARGQRRLGNVTEYYLWLKSYEPINGSTTPTTSISNDSNIESEEELYEILTNVTGGTGDLKDFREVQVSEKMKSIVKKHSELATSAKAKVKNEAAEAKIKLTDEIAAVRIGAKLDIPIAEKIIMQFALCPKGTFTMGSPEMEIGHDYKEKQVSVTLSKAFWMAKTEVTQAQWRAVMGSNPSRNKGDDLPVEKVGWDTAQEFIKKVNDSGLIPEGWKMTLPTEAQWEYACRAGTSTALNSGKDIKGGLKLCRNLDEVAWYEVNSGGETHPVGTKKPNAWGLHDMHGNISEWCQDWCSFAESLGGTDPYTPPLGGGGRAARGGGFGTSSYYCGSARRGMGSYPHIGFRPVLVPSEMIAIQEYNEAKKDADN